jgi:hypothetical protein
MKTYKEIVKDRQSYHQDGNLNSTHRSSLLVPQLFDHDVEISFINHFLLKRGYKNVGLRITGIDSEGNKIASKLIELTDPIVYSFNLTQMFERKGNGYEVEFFSSKNLYIPFSAVIINHKSPKAINQVHAYNRNLNDIFENDKINSLSQKEASIDVINQKDIQTFIVFQAGQFSAKGNLYVELLTDEKKYTREIPIDIIRYGNKLWRLNELFNDLPLNIQGVLKVQQPVQEMFYGRMLVGQIDNENNFTANHSFYDSSESSEYWDNKSPSYNYYPLIKSCENIIRFYPVMSPGILNIKISLHNKNGDIIAEFPVGELISPDNKGHETKINNIIQKLEINLDDVVTYGVHTNSTTEQMPTRVNHQIVYSRGNLEASINISLWNDNVFIPEKKKTFLWGQLILDRDYDSSLAITAIDFQHIAKKEFDVELELYGNQGLLASKSFKLSKATSQLFDLKKDFASEIKNFDTNSLNYIWYVVKCDDFTLNAFNACFNTKTNNITGEHSF